jgi:hypothetical protein
VYAFAGRTLDFGSGPYTIVGVAPRGFTGMDLGRVDVWLPLQTVAAQSMGTEWRDSRDWWFFDSVVRLAPGVTEARAVAELTTLHRRGRKKEIDAGNYDRDVKVKLTSVIAARGPDPSSESIVARLLLAVSLVVLLIGALNVANLLLARAILQRREIAVRLALSIRGAG